MGKQAYVTLNNFKDKPVTNAVEFAASSGVAGGIRGKGGVLAFPPGLGGTPFVENGSNNSEKTIPFTLFLPYKKIGRAHV